MNGSRRTTRMEHKIQQNIRQLVEYGLQTKLVEQEDSIYVTNQLLELFQLEEYIEGIEPVFGRSLEEILQDMLIYSIEQGIIEDTTINRDLFDTKIMATLVPRPSQVIHKFHEYYKESPEAATNYFYEFSQNTDYIRRYRIVKDEKWTTQTPYGQLDITINLSKPEKDPKAIAAAKHAKQSSYPKCLLCEENVGYAGRMNHPARQNHRIIPVELGGERWGFQYSPYVYYKEHSIIFNCAHVPMEINRETFVKLFDFVAQFPHYFIGSNADLPIVGGSILTHNHFQGGRYEFAMERAVMDTIISVKNYEDLTVGIVNWPMSVVRVQGEKKERVIQLADHILEQWRGYSDESVGIFAFTNEQSHNTITPIARMRDGKYEIDLVLRNNITTDEHPLGVFHPHEELHHIKKENIGLIEVMGLAVLPARLKEEMKLLGDYLVKGKDVMSNEQIAKHAAWAKEIANSYDSITQENIMNILQEEVGKVFMQVLEHAGVYKRNEEGQEAFHRFLESL